MSLVAYPSDHHQLSGFYLIILAGILSAVSTGHPEWRVWYMQEPSLPNPGVACVGMWQVCVYHHYSNSSRAKMCHRYTYHDTFLPPDIRLAQHLMLATNVLGFLGLAFSIWALRNLCQDIPMRKRAYNPLVISGILNIMASSCAFIAVICNYYAIKHVQGIAFPLSLHIPSKPHAQRVGGAMVVVIISALLYLIGGLIFLTRTPLPDIRIYPQV